MGGRIIKFSDWFKRKENLIIKCAQCFKEVDKTKRGGIIETLDSQNFKRDNIVSACKKVSETKNTFVCKRCKRELALKYFHKNDICAECFDKYEKRKVSTKLLNDFSEYTSTQHTYKPCVEIDDKKRRYIFLVGSDSGATNVNGNIIVIDNIPYIIRENNMIDVTDWNTVIQLAKKESLSTYTWIKNINEDNWGNYAFTHHPKNQPTDNNYIKVYTFKELNSDYSKAGMNQLVIDKDAQKPCIKHFVVNGHDGHDPWLVSVTNESTFADIRLLASALHIDGLADIDENNWINKIEVYLASNEYQIDIQSNIFNFIDMLKKSNVYINKIECIGLFERDKHLNCAYSLPKFLKEFKYDWRIFEFHLHCTEQNNSFLIKVTGWDRVAVAEYPRNINKIL